MSAAWSPSPRAPQISAETLRKIETGRAPTPAFFTVAALAGVLGVSMDELLALTVPAPARVPEPLPEPGRLPLTA